MFGGAVKDGLEPFFKLEPRQFIVPTEKVLWRLAFGRAGGDVTVEVNENVLLLKVVLKS